MEKEGTKPALTKKQIPFQVKSSLKRRNVDKHVVRAVTLNYLKLKDDILAEYASHGLGEDRYKIACDLIEYIRGFMKGTIEEVKEGEGHSKRDYGSTINIMLQKTEFRLVMKCCLEKSLKQIASRAINRVKDTNKETYVTTLKDYIDFLQTLDP